MKHQEQARHRYPQTLIDLRGLPGGTYGSLALVMVNKQTLEVRFGAGDFVRLTPDVARKVERAFDKFLCAPPPHGAVVEEEIIEEEEQRVVVRVEEEVEGEPKPLPRRRAPARRRTTSI